MPIVLSGLGTSHSFRCFWGLEETRLDYGFKSLDLGDTNERGAKPENYLASNSQSAVLTLAHNDFVLTACVTV